MLTIGKVAKAAGLGVETIRYYEREGLLPEPDRTTSGYRAYPESSITRLRFVLRAKKLGFTLTEIKDLLRLSDGEGVQAEVKQLTERKLTMIEERIADLQRMRDALQELSASCSGEGCIDQCPIIDALSADTDIHSEACHEAD